MSYTKREVVDNLTPLNKDLFDHIQDGIVANDKAIGGTS